jgi:O-antigen ligase/predicted Zn-dependent protease
MKSKLAVRILYWFVALSLLTPFVFWKDMRYPFWAPKSLFFQIIIELALPFYLYLIIADKRLRPNLKSPLTLSVLIFFGVFLLASIFGTNPNLSFWGNFLRMSGTFNLIHLVLFYFYFLLLYIADKNFTTKIYKFVVWSATLISGYGVWTYLGLPQLFQDRYLHARVASFLGNPIYLASYLVIPIFFSIILILREEVRLQKILYFGCLVSLTLGIYVSGTRSALLGASIGLLAAIIALLFFGESKKLRLSLGVFATVFVLGIASLVAFNSKLPKGSLLYRVSQTSDADSKARLIQWETALKGVFMRPVLGTGPETYYLTANKYFDPAILSFDSSFWDKPHNYLLELLVTTGFLGLLSYVAVIFFAGKTLYDLRKKNLTHPQELYLLFGALVAYQVQNLFIFDTMSAVLMFFVLLAILETKKETHFLEVSELQELSRQQLTFLLPALGIVFTVYAYNFIPGKILFDLNKAEVLMASAQTHEAYEYLQETKDLPYDFDRSELAAVLNEYSSLQIQSHSNEDETYKSLQETIDEWRELAVNTKNNPIYWLSLGDAYSLQDKVYKTDNRRKIYEAADNARTLAPNRVEPILLLAETEIHDYRYEDAKGHLYRILELIPSDTDSHWHMNNKLRAIHAFQLLAKAYDEQKNYTAAIEVYNKAMTIDPYSVLLYSGLATSYSKKGDHDMAVATAKKILEFEPESTFQVDAFIKTLK